MEIPCRNEHTLLRRLQKLQIVSRYFRDYKRVCYFNIDFGYCCLILLSQSLVKQF